MLPRRLFLGLALSAGLLSAAAQAQDRNFILLASTTSTEQSGLFAFLLPAFKATSGVDVRVVALGTGQALDMGRRGDADVVLVHDQPAEEKFVAEGFGVRRLPVMSNDFVLVGPKSDPAGVKGQDIAAAFGKLLKSQVGFVSRGDNSGTHAAEIRFWKLAGIDLATAKPAGYKECGCGMGPALSIASATNGYLLTDRATWLSFRARGELAVLVEGDKRLFNPYGVMLVNPARHAHIKKDLGQAFVDWLVSPAGQARIGAYRIDGQPLFFPGAQAR